MSDVFVALVAHPDDESLIAGGTLALAAATGEQTGVVSLTRGEEGPGSGPDGDELGELRERELAEAGAALGVSWTTCLSHPDGELEWADAHAIAREVAALLATRRPTAVLTFGEDGLYWHPDHIATRAIAGMAVELLENDSAAQGVWIYESVWRPELAPGLVAAARERGLPTDLWGLPPESFGSDAAGPAVGVDVSPVLDRKLAGLRAHRSQLNDDHLLAALPDDLAARFLGREEWRVARRAGDGDGPLGGLTATGRADG